MKILVLYFSTAVIFLAIDLVGLRLLVKPVFDRHVAHGLLCYGTYEFTNYATLKDWSTEQVMVDTLWGGALTALTAWIGVMFVRWIW